MKATDLRVFFSWALVLLTMMVGARAVISAAETASTTSADVVYVNGTVLTMNATNAIAQAVAVEGEKVKAVGSTTEIQALIGPKTRVVDLAGKTLIPGFVDAHSHFPESGIRALYRVDCNSPPIGSTKSIADIISRLKEAAQKTPRGQWIQAFGYDDTLLAEKRHPTRDDLDQATTEHPVWLSHVSGHLGVANSLALAQTNITEATPDPKGGAIRRYRGTTKPNGVFEENALFQMIGKLPPLSPEQNLAAITAAAEEYASKGVTTAQNGLAFDAAIDSLIAAATQGVLPIRVIIWPGFKPTDRKIPPNPRLKLGAVKLIADGAIQGYTGYLSKPYATPPPGGKDDYVGYPLVSREDLTAQVKKFHRAGYQIAIHGNGDAAIDNILYAYREAQKETPRPDTRHIIVHSQMAREDQLDAMKELGVIPSFFSLHTYYWGDRHRDIFMGRERAYRISPAKSAIARGLRFTIHTDAPVVPMNPLLLVWAAVNRISTGGDTIGAEQRISPMDALRAVTINAAWQSFDETNTGSIESGKLADLVILSENPLLVPERIRDIQVLETIVGGKTVYKNW
jgi:predicted amidohydrolase YtcJ